LSLFLFKRIFMFLNIINTIDKININKKKKIFWSLKAKTPFFFLELMHWPLEKILFFAFLTISNKTYLKTENYKNSLTSKKDFSRHGSKMLAKIFRLFVLNIICYGLKSLNLSSEAPNFWDSWDSNFKLALPIFENINLTNLYF
jgi:hypothetical protein